MPQSYVANYSHIVFSTAGRKPWIQKQWRDQLYSYFGGILKNTGGRLIEVGGIADHVHLLASLSRNLCIADAVSILKSNSSRWVKEYSPRCRKFRWQGGYAAFSVSQSALESVREYIRLQEEHHRRMSFQEELKILLWKHGLLDGDGER